MYIRIKLDYSAAVPEKIVYFTFSPVTRILYPLVNNNTTLNPTNRQQSCEYLAEKNLSIRQTVWPELENTGEGVARDGLQSVSREVQLDEVGEVPEGVPVELGDAALGEADLLEVDQVPGGEHVPGQDGHLVTRHLQHLKQSGSLLVN